MKNFTKIIKIAMAILLVFGFASCKNQSGNTGGTNPPQPNPEIFVITFSNPAHGTLSAKRADGVAEFKSGDTATKDEVITFTVAPEANYEVEAWSGAIQDGTDKNKAKLKVASSITVSVTLKENTPTPQPTPETFVITFSNPAHGTLTAKRADGVAEFKSGDAATKDEEITFTVAPEANYEVEAWSGATQDGTNKNKATLKVASSITVSVTLKENIQPPQPNPPELNITVEGVSFVMKKIPEGKNVKLGSASFAVNPIHTIESISEFYMGETEVTQELWNAVMKNNPSWFNGDPQKTSKQPAQGEEQTKRPVESISWYDAVNFCNELTKAVTGSESECVYTITNIEKTNVNYPNVITKAEVSQDFSKKGYRLATEAEWEWAAKGGIEDAEYPGVHREPNEDEKAFKKRVLEYAWTDLHPNVQRRTHEVKKLKANEYGLYDMAGNVMEWCNDWWSKLEENKQYEKDYSGVATPDANKSIKIQKGGSYMYTTTLSELATRPEDSRTQIPENISKDRGLRIVCRK